MTRIALVAPYAPPVHGGISTFVSGLSQILKENGHEVSTLAGEGRGDQERHSDLGVGRTFASKVSDRLEAIRPEVVHCHSHWYALAAGVRYCRRNPDARLVFSFHTTSIPFLRPLFGRLLSRAHVSTFVSAAQLSELRSVYRLGGDLRVLRPATLGVRFAPSESVTSKDIYNLDGAFPILMFVGPLEYPQKVAGVIDLVQAFANIRRTYPRARLLIVGDGTQRARVDAVVAALNESVTVTGFVDDPRGLLARADVYCHISRQEGLPTALLEAMSQGCCVIGSRVGGIPEVLDDSNGVVVGAQPTDVEHAILSLLEDPSRRKKLGETARRTINQFYTWEARLPQILNIYGLAG